MILRVWIITAQGRTGHRCPIRVSVSIRGRPSPTISVPLTTIFKGVFMAAGHQHDRWTSSSADCRLPTAD